MAYRQRFLSSVPVFLIAALLASCGGGGSNGKAEEGNRDDNPNDSPSSSENAPPATGDLATDGVNWFNFRRQQAGLDALARNVALDRAAADHSRYQSLNDEVTHTQERGKPGFTGATLGDRLQAAGYRFDQRSYSYGEVISASGIPSGFVAADDLIAAIYHRFVIFEPRFREVGAGSAQEPERYIYFTTNFAANGLGPGLGKGGVAVYPVNGQTRIPRNFFSDREIPDPVPERNEVGYPISVHADITTTITVQTFTLQPRGGQPVVTRLLSQANDRYTPASAVAIVPLEVLAANTTYDVRFAGTVGGVQVERLWSFSTQ